MYDFYLEPLFWVLAFTLLSQLYIYLFVFRRIAAHKAPEATDLPYAGPVSIVIAAKNEDDNLRENLPLLFAQDYPEFEVIVVNDQSWDGTKELLEELQQQFPKLKVVTIEEHVNEFAGKKLALTLGIKAASHELLVLTDADCRPLSDQWLKCMASAYTDSKTQFVLGYSPYQAFPTFLNALIRFDTYYTALQYFSFALGGNPYMGVGRNLSYRKSLFFKVKGFAPYMKVVSGDDDLFVNQHATADNTAVMLSPESFMLSQPKRKWSSWMRQKRRHLSVGRLYRARHKRALGFIWLFNVLFYAAFVIGLIFIQPFWIALAVFGLRMLVQLIIGYMSMSKLHVKSLWPLFPVFDILYQLIYLPFMSILSLFRRKNKW